MTRKPRIPSYRLDKPTGQAVVVLNGKSFYLGKFGSPTNEEYERVIAEWLANHHICPAMGSRGDAHPSSAVKSLTIEELIHAYWQFVKTYYVKNGCPTSEQDTIRQALRFVRKLYHSTPAHEFGPLALKAVRQAMIQHPVTQ
jgi:hypothetical protein